MKPTIGRIVHYVSTDKDAEQVESPSNERCHPATLCAYCKARPNSIASRMRQDPVAWPQGAQAHIGNHHYQG